MTTNKPEVKVWVISAYIPYSGFQKHFCTSKDDAQKSRDFLEKLRGEVEENLLIDIGDYRALQAKLDDMERDYLTIIEAQDAEHRKQVARLQAECERLRK